MTMVSERVDAVIGVDTHTDTHTAAVCDAGGGVLAVLTVPADEDGYAELLDAAAVHAPGPRIVWGIEGTGSYGAELTEALHGWDQEVIEVGAQSAHGGRARTTAPTRSRLPGPRSSRSRPRPRAGGAGGDCGG